MPFFDAAKQRGSRSPPLAQLLPKDGSRLPRYHLGWPAQANPLRRDGFRVARAGICTRPALYRGLRLPYRRADSPRIQVAADGGNRLTALRWVLSASCRTHPCSDCAHTRASSPSSSRAVRLSRHGTPLTRRLATAAAAPPPGSRAPPPPPTSLADALAVGHLVGVPARGHVAVATDGHDSVKDRAVSGRAYEGNSPFGAERPCGR